MTEQGNSVVPVFYINVPIVVVFTVCLTGLTCAHWFLRSSQSHQHFNDNSVQNHFASFALCPFSLLRILLSETSANWPRTTICWKFLSNFSFRLCFTIWTWCSHNSDCLTIVINMLFASLNHVINVQDWRKLLSTQFICHSCQSSSAHRWHNSTLPDRRQPILLWAMRRFLTAFSNRVLMLFFTVSSSKPVETCGLKKKSHTKTLPNNWMNSS